MSTLEQTSTPADSAATWQGHNAGAHQPAFRSGSIQGSSLQPWALPPAALTRREVDVLRLLAWGHTNRQAAELLGLSVRTVENHRANLLGKLGAVSRVEIVSYAAAHNLI